MDQLPFAGSPITTRFIEYARQASKPVITRLFDVTGKLKKKNSQYPSEPLSDKLI